MTQLAATAQRPLCLLSLDGGGIRGVSELVILEEMMHRLKRKGKLDYEPLPADYFDLICGTSTGGLIALLLGRLRMTASEAVDVYRNLAKDVFSDKKVLGIASRYKASKLEKAIKAVLEKKLGAGRTEEKMFVSEGDGPSCRTFVCSSAASHIKKQPRLFRTWLADENPGYNCAIWEAARATSAAAMVFKPIQLGDPGLQEDFIDAGLGCNNPVKQLIPEAIREFGRQRDIACVVSIGIGKPKVARLVKSGIGVRKALSLIQVLEFMVTDSEEISEEFRKQFKSLPGLYYRFNVDKGLENVSFQEWERLGDVKTHTIEYLRNDQVSEKLDEVVEALLGKAIRLYELGQLDASVSPVPSNVLPKNYYRYPNYKASYFIARHEPLKQIKEYHQRSRDNMSANVVILLGMGGCGKSQLALEYCEQAELKNDFSAVFWVDALSPATVAQSYTAIAKVVGNSKIDATDTEGNISIVLETLATWTMRWLLVFDNFDKPEAFDKRPIREYFPRNRYGSVLITSRCIASKSLGHAISVSDMKEDEALDLLFRRSQFERNEMSVSKAKKIVNRLGYLALAVDQAGAYIAARNINLDQFMDHFNRRREVVLKETPNLWDYRRKKDETEAEQSMTVATTWELSFEQITEDNEIPGGRRHFFLLVAFFDGRKISEELFHAFFNADAPSWMNIFSDESSWDPFKFLDIVAELQRLSLIQITDSTLGFNSFSVHPVIQDWAKMRLRPSDRQEYTTEAIQILSQFLSTHNHEAMDLDTKLSTVSHIDNALENDGQYLVQGNRLGEVVLAQPTCNFADFLRSQGQYDQAEILYNSLLTSLKGQLGPRHLRTLLIMEDLGIVYSEKGQYSQAEALFQQVLAKRKEELGPKDLLTLRAMTHLGTVYYRQQQYSESEPLTKQALAEYKEQLGSKHDSTLLGMQNLASVYIAQQRHSEAEGLYLQVVAEYKDQLGPTHLKTLQAMENLSILYSWQQQASKAEGILTQVLTEYMKQLGSEHPRTLTTLDTLAICYSEQGQHMKARLCYEQSHAGLEKRLGPYHQKTLHVLHNLATSSDSLHKEQLYRQALAGRIKQLGPEHQDTLRTLHSLGSFYYNQHQYSKAEPIYEQALTGREKQLGRQHKDTIETMHNLANVYHNQDQFEKAYPLFEQVLAGRERELGLEHHDTLHTVFNLACTYHKLRQYNKAEPLFKRALAGRGKQLGSKHPYTRLIVMCLVECRSLTS